MSAKAFYQTFFQTEQVFRRADDALAFPALHDSHNEDLDLGASAMNTAGTADQPAHDEAIAVAITDPVLPATPPDIAVPESVLVELTAEASLPQPEATAEVTATATRPIAQSASPPHSNTKPPVLRRPVTPQISQKVLILVDEELLPSDLLFLEKILNAVHLDIDGVDLLNVHGTGNVNFSELLQGKYIHHFFTFGVPFSRINLDILMDRYQPVRFDGITFLMADSLPAIETDVALKKKLWEALKKVFLWR